MKHNIPSVKSAMTDHSECVHCRFHFPQFNALTICSEKPFIDYCKKKYGFTVVDGSLDSFVEALNLYGNEYYGNRRVFMDRLGFPCISVPCCA